MTKRMVDGEIRKIKHQIFAEIRDGQPLFQVFALREDAETPYVILKVGDQTAYLTDVGAHELCERIKKALSILPSSK